MKNPFISDRIKEYRKLKGMTQAELANKTGISLSNISKYESGNRTPKTEYLFKIANALNVSIDALVSTNSYCERNFTNLVEELGYRFEIEASEVSRDAEYNIVDIEYETYLFHNKKCYRIPNSSEEKLKADVIAYIEFKLQQLINESSSSKEGE